MPDGSESLGPVLLAEVDRLVADITGIDPGCRDGGDVLLYDQDVSGAERSLDLDSIAVFEVVSAIADLVLVEFHELDGIEEAERLGEVLAIMTRARAGRGGR